MGFISQPSLFPDGEEKVFLPERKGEESRLLEEQIMHALLDIFNQPFSVRILREDTPGRQLVHATPLEGISAPFYFISMLNVKENYSLPFEYGRDETRRRIVRVNLGKKGTLERRLLQLQEEQFPPISLVKTEHDPDRYSRGVGEREYDHLQWGYVNYLLPGRRIYAREEEEPLFISLGGVQQLRKSVEKSPHYESIRPLKTKFIVLTEERMGKHGGVILPDGTPVRAWHGNQRKGSSVLRERVERYVERFYNTLAAGSHQAAYAYTLPHGWGE